VLISFDYAAIKNFPLFSWTTRNLGTLYEKNIKSKENFYHNKKAKIPFNQACKLLSFKLVLLG